jgi:hypothetical protein
MYKLFGLSIRRKPLTDAEYIEQVRRNVKRSRRYGFWCLPLLLASVVGLGWAAETLFRALFNVFFALVAGLNADIVFGIMIGFMLGVATAKLLHSLTIPVDNRLFRLLLKHHDALVGLGYVERSLSAPRNLREAIIDRLSQRRLLGMRVLSKRLTNYEYVERIRTLDARGRRIFPFLAVILCGALAILFCHCIRQGLRIGGKQFFWGFAGGIVPGVAFGSLILFAVHYYANMILALKRDRSAELLVKYHDILVDLARSEHQSSPPAQAEQGRAGEGGTER